jgi:hypothetical protein
MGEGMAKVVEDLLSKCKALRSNLSTLKNKKKKKKEVKKNLHFS